MLHDVILARRHVLPLAALLLSAVCIVAPLPAHGQEQPQALTSGSGSPGAEGEPRTPADVKRIQYIPESVKAQLREELKQEVLDEIKRDGLTPVRPARPAPSWLERFKLNGDVRSRYERVLFGRGNANDGEFPDFNAINTNKPFDVNFADVANERYLNVDQNRTRPRLRARLGVDADVAQGFSAGLRLASGDGSTPISTNQTLGGSPGNFSKYQFWLDRASLRYQPIRALAVEIGRFQNPFFTTDLVWDEDVNLDGFAVQAKFPVVGDVTPFLTAGVFPVYTSIFNFPPEQTRKFPSIDKWLAAVQLGGVFRPVESLTVKLGAAFYYFHKLEGRLSSPCDTSDKNVSCDTDESRPAFAQKGNTYMALRVPNEDALAAEAGATIDKPVPRYEFFGLASRFRPIALTGRVEYVMAPLLKFAVDGEVVRNVGFSGKQISGVALNNTSACDASGDCSRFDGGRDGYMARVTVGSPAQNARWDWNVSLAYRHVQSDAVPDAFNDSDFGLGGTNLKGYVAGGALAVAENVWTGVRWLSADAIAGPPYKVDVLQVDLGARF